MNPVAAQLRQRALLCRRAASVRTKGDLTVDRELIMLAMKLERIAEDLEQGMGLNDEIPVPLLGRE